MNTRALERRLQLGGSLVFIEVHELFKGIERLVEIEEMSRVGSGADLYAGFKHRKEFDLHFEQNDAIVVQIHGKKDLEGMRAADRAVSNLHDSTAGHGETDRRSCLGRYVDER